MVAYAAPLIPNPKTKIATGSPWLDALAVLKIEDYVEEKQFEQFFQEKGEAGHEF